MTVKKTAVPKVQEFFNPFPKYLQVREVLKRRMYRDYELGDRLPTEELLGREFGVSRETVREALRGLEQEGLIQRHRAKGTFFVRRPEQPADDRVTGMIEDFSSLHLDTHAQVLKAERIRTPAEMAQIPGAGEQIFHISRLRFFEGKPLVLHDAFLSMKTGEQVVSLDLAHSSITEIVEEELHARATEERQQIEALVADTEMARLLEIPIGAPVLFITRLFKVGDGDQFMLFRSYYRADRYRYTVDFTAHGKSQKQTRNTKPSKPVAGGKK
ncbi:GntR family transcriptional regulator [Burkholderia sp. WAC0059]|uniref:GntR family transcriptional regulator n=1 Tax=Burkholderia sp. WAC0059 TaxID=2066022 RepID=UPI0015E09FB4|nr:GntR family transcriptional regulator [Burkholderia sp. WAC0059]